MAKKTEPPDKPLTTDLRAMLKEIVHKELAALPETLATLDPVQRLNIICKLVGYVLPKVEAVNHKQGEPRTWGLDD
ncbi:MAG: hypothetical protein KA138_05030 [Saprospiraceae bacterium]|jgi:hypothetical protein|nr:hypothetical protein [Saprospiraceae bacterium]